MEESKNKEDWLKVIKSELESLEKMKTWKLVEKPERVNWLNQDRFLK